MGALYLLVHARFKLDVLIIPLLGKTTHSLRRLLHRPSLHYQTTRLPSTYKAPTKTTLQPTSHPSHRYLHPLSL